MNIFVGNIAWSVDGDELKELFEKYGQVERARIIWDAVENRSKGYGFVEMPDQEEALKAIIRLNGFEFRGRLLHAEEANVRKDWMD